MVEIKNIRSDIKFVNVGVPQGSNLGPTLFLIYVNGVFKILKDCESFMFADDLLILVSHEIFLEANRIMQRNINHLIRWSHDCKLLINGSKTKIMHFYNQYLRKDEVANLIIHSNDCLHTFNVNCSCNKIESVKEFKYLGVTFDQDMTLNTHINSIIRKLRSIIPQIYSLKSIVNEKMLRCIYYGLAHPFLLYGITSWGFAETGSLTNLKKMQTRILKKMKKGDKFQSVGDVYKFWNVMSLSNLSKFSILKENLLSDWGGVIRYHEHNTRTIVNAPFLVPIRENRFQSKTVKYILPRLWNELPNDIKHISDYILLCMILKKHFTEV